MKIPNAKASMRTTAVALVVLGTTSISGTALAETCEALEVTSTALNVRSQPTASGNTAVGEPDAGNEAIVNDGSSPPDVSTSYWFSHSLGEVITACVGAGLAVETLREYPHSNREVNFEIYEGQSAQLPMCYMLVAMKS